MKEKRSFFNLDVTHARAVEQFAALDPHQVAQCAAVSFDEPERCFALPFLNRTYRVRYPDGMIYQEDGSEASLYLAIIMLHYLATADGSPLAGQWINFRDLPGGHIYIEPFRGRAIEPFLKTFGGQPEEFAHTAKTLGGSRGSKSGVSMVIPVMPRVPLNFVLWPGDDELPASANILFDARAASYLPTEDYAHLPAMVIGEMKAQL